jgi:hypothetical protein
MTQCHLALLDLIRPSCCCDSGDMIGNGQPDIFTNEHMPTVYIYICILYIVSHFIFMTIYMVLSHIFFFNPFAAEWIAVTATGCAEWIECITISEIDDKIKFTNNYPQNVHEDVKNYHIKSLKSSNKSCSTTLRELWSNALEFVPVNMFAYPEAQPHIRARSFEK